MSKLNFHDIESVMDSAAGNAAQKISDDSLETKAIDSEIMSLRKYALYAVLQLADDILEKDLDDNELPSDRLDAYITQADDESDSIDDYTAQIVSANIADALVSLGVAEDTVASIFSDDTAEADAAIESASEIVSENIPTNDDELTDFVNKFVFGADKFSTDENEEVFDAVLGKKVIKKNAAGQKIAYRAVKAIRNGKVTIVNKRINSGVKVRLTSKQKAALKKMLVKSRTGSALSKRKRSFAKAQRLNLA